MKKTLKILSLFTGCGGLDLGFEMAKNKNYNFKVVWANDNFESACKTFEKNFKKPIDKRDVWTIDFKKIPDCDVLLAGFPCQDFSVLSKRKGINVKRGMLYTRIVDALKAKKPLFFVAENVKGLLSANKGKAIEIIKKHLKEAGYNIKYTDVVKFAEYGVPQIRERVIIIGFRKDLNIDFEFPKPTHKNDPVIVEVALRNVEKARFNNEKQKLKLRTIEILKAIPPGGNYKQLKGKKDNKGKSLYVKGLMSNIYRRLHPRKPSPTIIANGGGGTWGYHHKKPRSLTNRERARLQTFPDNFIFEGTIGEVRKQIGNAVPPLGARVIAKSILKSLEKARLKLK